MAPKQRQKVSNSRPESPRFKPPGENFETGGLFQMQGMVLLAPGAQKVLNRTQTLPKWSQKVVRPLYVGFGFDRIWGSPRPRYGGASS
jgi:hypothetical protein